jgi:hypothetical protein
MAVYETFIPNLSELKDGQEQILHIRDAENYVPKVVKAVVSSSPEKLPGADILRIRWSRGHLAPKNWAIKISQDLGSPADQEPD